MGTVEWVWWDWSRTLTHGGAGFLGWTPLRGTLVRRLCGRGEAARWLVACGLASRSGKGAQELVGGQERPVLLRGGKVAPPSGGRVEPPGPAPR